MKGGNGGYLAFSRFMIIKKGSDNPIHDLIFYFKILIAFMHIAILHIFSNSSPITFQMSFKIKASYLLPCNPLSKVFKEKKEKRCSMNLFHSIL